MSTYEFERNVAGDIVGVRKIEAVCRHGKHGFCPYCKECGEEDTKQDQAESGGLT